MNAKKVYICERCDTVHEHEYRAEECCKPDVLEEWQCSTCEECYDDKEIADACCPSHDEPVTPRCTKTIDMFGGDL